MGGGEGEEEGREMEMSEVGMEIEKGRSRAWSD
jgi:hypothetical protein